MCRFFLSALLLLSGLLGLGTAQARQPVVIFGDADYPPYSYLNAAGEPSGIYVELLRPIFDQMTDYAIEIQLVPWERALAALEAGEVLAIFPPYFYPASVRPYIGHYSVPIYEEEVVLFCRRNLFTSHPRRWPDDFFGRVIGINQGFAFGGEAFWLAVQRGEVQLSEAETNWQNLMMLMDQRIDCYMNDRLSIEHQLAHMVNEGEWQGGLPQEVRVIEQHTGHLAFTLAHWPAYPYYHDFIALFDALYLGNL